MLFSRFRALFRGAGLLASLTASRPAPAQAGLILVPAESSLSVHGIPLPQDAAPLLAASLSLENLHALAPKSGELGRGWLRAVVYNYPVPAPPDEVAAYYRSV